MASPLKTITRQVKPVLSLNEAEAKKRVLNLYKDWALMMPIMLRENFVVPISREQFRDKVKQEFFKNAHIKDIRVIDLLVIHGREELENLERKWKNSGNMMYKFKDTVEPKPKDFMSKFISGNDP